ncbi:TonB-dependent receptor [Flavihumibacter sp. ZG627]|uniref:SusC/RagA family TonB-linked outer membrane protein n=1 Tax=Flavihumibacter sp. ZG627 TaxID=1463156 RepID=UPI00155ABE88|nr:TonB-dependent receptor [Flavihumibacter sp. ZG627]
MAAIKKLTGLMWSLLLLTALSVQAQTRQISGKVSDQKTGLPIPGASVTVKGTNVVTATDADGSFSLQVPQNATTLVFTSIGYGLFEMAISDIMNVQLNVSEGNLSEVIVTGYGSQIKKDLTGNIARIKAKDLENVPLPSVDAALQGRAAGVYVNSQSGKLGQAVTVRVRGNSSISASSQPLYVLDGVPITTDDQSTYGGAMNPLVDLNPNDIESVEVLKDAAAGAIYGSRAANGVVLITTKRGKTGKTNISVNFQTGFSEATNRVGFLNAKEYADLFFRAAAYSDEQESLDPNDPDSYTTYARGFLDYFSFGEWSETSTANYDWQDKAFQRGGFNQADVQLSGGTDKTKFFASLQYLDQIGTIVGNDLRRLSGRLTVDHKANNWLNVGFTSSLARTTTHRLPGDNAFSNPLQASALPNITPFIDPNTGLMAGTPPGDVNIPLYYNPLIQVEYADFIQEGYRNFSNAYASASILPGLSFKTEFGLDLLAQDEESYYQTQTVRNVSTAVNGLGEYTTAMVFNYNTNNYFTYTKEFGKSNLDATLGMQFQKSLSKYGFTEGQDFPSNSYQKIASAATKSDGSTSETEYAFLSYFARANYKYDDKYLLSLSIRRDASSRFGRNSRNGYFPAVSAGWILSNEKFMSDIDLISFLKIRGSYGSVGNAEIGNFPQLGLFTGDAGYAGSAGQRPSQIANPDLKWETTDQLDLGIDFGLINNRISGEVDYYVKKTSGLLLNVNVPATSGFNSQVKNVGKLENKGWEFVLNTQNLIGEFKWSTNINLAFNKGKVVDINGQVIEGGVGSMNRVMEGQPVGVFYTVEYAGVDPDNGDALFYLNTDNNGQLDKTTVNSRGYGQAQRIVSGDPNPNMIFGFTNNFSYKGLDLTVFFNGVTGNEVNIYGMGRYSSASFRFEDNQTKDQLGAWTTPGQVTDIPQARLFYNNGAQISSRYIVDGSFMRLRNITLGYNLPSAITKKLKIERLRVYASGQNLLTFTKYPYWDPEVNSDDFDSNIAKGNDFYTPPQPKTILFGINVGL